MPDSPPLQDAAKAPKRSVETIRKEYEQMEAVSPGGMLRSIDQLMRSKKAISAARGSETDQLLGIIVSLQNMLRGYHHDMGTLLQALKETEQTEQTGQAEQSQNAHGELDESEKTFRVYDEFDLEIAKVIHLAQARETITEHARSRNNPVKIWTEHDTPEGLKLEATLKDGGRCQVYKDLN